MEYRDYRTEEEIRKDKALDEDLRRAAWTWLTTFAVGLNLVLYQGLFSALDLIVLLFFFPSITALIYTFSRRDIMERQRRIEINKRQIEALKADSKRLGEKNKTVRKCQAKNSRPKGQKPKSISAKKLEERIVLFGKIVQRSNITTDEIRGVTTWIEEVSFLNEEIDPNPDGKEKSKKRKRRRSKSKKRKQ